MRVIIRIVDIQYKVACKVGACSAVQHIFIIRINELKEEIHLAKSADIIHGSVHQLHDLCDQRPLLFTLLLIGSGRRVQLLLDPPYARFAHFVQAIAIIFCAGAVRPCRVPFRQHIVEFLQVFHVI